MFKKIVLVAFLFLLSNSVFSQIAGEDEVYLDGDKVEAKFQGGDLNKFADFVLANLDKSKIEKEGQLICAFVINELGELKNIRIVKDLGGESAMEMIRVLRLSPKWQPATRNGKPFSTTYKVPFQFTKAPASPKAVEKASNVVSDYTKNTGIEAQAEFVGGRQAFYEYMSNNLKFPKLSQAGKAMVSFIIDTDGKVIEIKILKDPSNGPAGSEIVRVLQNCPRWKPAIHENGLPVRSQFTLPITLKK